MIEAWLTRFHEGWCNHDIPVVLSLFTDTVEYWETPFRRLASKDEIMREWAEISMQEDIEVTSEIFTSTPEGKHTVRWNLRYSKGGTLHTFSGIYLIGLNAEGKCYYFYFVGEEAV